MSDKEFIALFMPFCEYYGKESISKGILAQYYEDLGTLSVDKFKTALSTIRKNRKYSNMPSIAEILEAANGSLEQKVAFALDELRFAVSKYGTNKSICFEDKTIMSVVNAVGGWEKIGRLEGKDWENFQKFEFEKLYKIYFNHQDKAPEYLIGSDERNNSFFNKDTKYDKVYFIGSENKEPISVAEFKANIKNPITSQIQKAFTRIAV